MGRGQVTLRDQFAGIFGTRRGLGLHSRFRSEDYTSVLSRTKDEVAQAICNDDLSCADLKPALAWLRHPENANDVRFRRALVQEMLYLVLVEEYSLGVEAWLRVINPNNSNARARRIGTLGWPRRNATDELRPNERIAYEETIARLQEEATSALLTDTVFTEGRKPKTTVVIDLMRGELRNSIARSFVDSFSSRNSPKLLFTPQQLDHLVGEHGIDEACRPLKDERVWRSMIEEADRANFTRSEMSPQQRSRARRRLLDVVYEEVEQRLSGTLPTP